MNIITKLRKLNIELTLIDGKLRVNAPEGVVNNEILSEIKYHKEDLIAYISKVSEKNDYFSIPKVGKRVHYPLSAVQKQLYFLHKLDKTSLAYNMPKVLELTGNLDESKLKEVLNQLIGRHESLRTCFTTVNDEPVQIIHEQVDMEIEHYKPEAGRIDNMIRDFIRPFDLHEVPLFRIGLAEIAMDNHLLMIDMHHIITDGISQGILIKDFMSLYNGEKLQQLDIQQKDYAVWQQEEEQIINIDKHRTYWLEEYKDEPEVLNLPTDFTRPAVKGYSGGKFIFNLDQEGTNCLKAIAEEERTTLFMIMLSIYYVFLSKLSNQEDIVVGIPIAGREHVELEKVMGMFMNTLPLRNHPKRELSFTQFVQSTSSKTISGIDHQSFSYEALIDELRLSRNVSRNPLFDVVFGFENYENDKLDIPGLSLAPYDTAHEVSKFDLSFEAKEIGNSLFMSFEYSTELFKKETIRRFEGYLLKIISQVSKNKNILLSEIEILSEEEKHQLLNTFNNTVVAFPKGETVISLFEKQAATTPDNVAIKLPHMAFTYREIEERTNQIASYLREVSGVEKGDFVGLLMEREEDLIPSVFGILKAGAAYIPIDPKYPTDRIRAILDDSKLKVVLSKSKYYDATEKFCVPIINLDEVAKDINEQNTDPVGVDIKPDSLAYVIYTSGSTGKPKGVMIEHGSVYNIIKFMQDRYPLNEGDCHMMKTTYSFDVSVSELFGWFHNGGAIYMLPAGAEGDSDELLAAITNGGVTHMNFVPSMLAVFVDALTLKKVNNLEPLRYVFACGEALPLELVKRFNALNTGVCLENIYGPTEATIYSCGYSTSELKDGASVPIGKPFNNISLYILDQHDNNLQPVGVPGELHIGGEAVARGYLHNESLTSEKFIANPFINGGRIYKTGDLARWLPDGNVEYLGRLDNQVKIRGFRIELGEIENRLANHSEVKEAMVIVKGETVDKYLVAYYVSVDEIDTGELNRFLSEKLPGYMVPSYFVHLKHFPLTSNGKMDRKALPDPEVGDGEFYVTPSNPTEKKLVDIWSSILKIEKDVVGVKTSFFELGGNSLRATVLANKIFKEFGVEIPLKEIFWRQDIQQLSEYVIQAENPGYISITKAPEASYYPASSAQKRLYFLYEFDKTSLAYNLPQALHLSGELDLERLKYVFLQLIARHESLRTSFEVIKGVPAQRIASVAETDFELEFFRSSQKEEVVLIIKNFIRPFDLTQPSLLRVGLIEIAPEEHVMVVDIHHIITDGISQGILIQEFMALYNGEELNSLRLQYRDYSVWQQNEIQQAKIEKQKAFWLNEFSDTPVALDLPLDFPRPTAPRYLGATQSFTISVEETKQLKVIANSEGVTMFMLVLSLYNILLSKLGNQEDVVVGIPVSGRQHADLDNVIGMFVNTLPLRICTDKKQTFRGFIAAVKQSTLACFDHQAYPYEVLIDDLKLERGTTHNPLFDVMFVFESFENSPMEIPELTLKPYNIPRSVSKFDLSLEAAELDGQLEMNFEYSTELFKEETIERFIKYFKNIISSVVRDPNKELSEIEILSFKEQDQLLKVFNDTKFFYSKTETVISLFETHVSNHPEITALVSGERMVSYGQLNNRSNTLAKQIKEQFQLGKNDKIGLLFRPGIEMIAAILGVLKAGCAYVSLSPDAPEDRNSFILTNCGAKLLLIEEALLAKSTNIPSYISNGAYVTINDDGYTDLVVENPSGRASSEDSIYVIYTSGTTGTPKGVEVKHGGIFNMLHFFNQCFHVNPGTNMSQVANITFDASAFEIWSCLSHGGTLHIAPDEARPDPGLMQNWLVDHQIEITYQPTAIAEYLLRNDWNEDQLCLRVMNIAGDRLNFTPTDVLPFKVYNLYGPTEDSIWTSWDELNKEGGHLHYSIGKPIANKKVFILNDSNGLQPIGVAGELCISGDGLAKGYVNNETLTREKFVKNPFYPGELMYKTGDLARWLSDGTIAFLGRIDNQVKIRGYRIELGEIESQLLKYTNIKGATVIVKGERGEKQLIGYYVSTESIDSYELRRYLLKTLPDYMVPAHFVHMDSMPFTPNGKLDRKKLPDPELNLSVDYIGASNDVEEKLVEIWSSILNIEKDKISTHSNFFELGGHSINIINLSHEIKEHFECQISVANMFRLPTIAMIADFIISGDHSAEDMAGNIEESLIEAEDNINNLLNQLED